MKKIIILLLGLSFALSCGQMDDVYREYADAASQTVYLSKLKGVEFIPGNNRVKMTIPAQTDSRIKMVNVSWDNNKYTDNFDIDIKLPQEHIIENVSPGSHIFEVYSADKKGNRSIVVLFSVRVLVNATDDF